jgi:hypothetical protein
LDRLISITSTQQVFSKGEDDAKTILSSKDAESHLGDATIDVGEGLDTELSMDEDIIRSGPYSTHFRTLVQRSFQSVSPPATALEKKVSQNDSQDTSSSVPFLQPQALDQRQVVGFTSSTISNITSARTLTAAMPSPVQTSLIRWLGRLPLIVRRRRLRQGKNQ